MALVEYDDLAIINIAKRLPGRDRRMLGRGPVEWDWRQVQEVVS